MIQKVVAILLNKLGEKKEHKLKQVMVANKVFENYFLIHTFGREGRIDNVALISNLM